MLWEGISGKFGSRAKAGAARPRTPSPELPRAEVAVSLGGEDQRATVPSGSSASPYEMIEALTQSMKQLQDLQLKSMKKSDDEATPEVVKDCNSGVAFFGCAGRRDQRATAAGLVGAGNYRDARLV